ncbi:MAG: phosphate signaling complex protein PhoU [Bacteroidetes bacterium]|uniref:Phosphate-specific transport system accessory protein PhoU n=1 Tax=Candidatus Merdivivens pullistercoris TaxID=2840873 RepID=A0A9D9I1S4_9BACT|nr:phosphate signaling complex protein PhoU [Candidatus Merdivivens pullistercoris]
MVKFIDTELKLIQSEVVRMWTLVYDQIGRTKQAVLGLDKNIAQQVSIRERLVDAFELKIDSEIEDFIALYTPVAIDLRFVLAMLKINNDLERIGDYAYSIARFVRETDAVELDAELVRRLRLEQMFSVVLEMMSGLKQSLEEMDPAHAVSVIAMDDTLDEVKSASDGILVEYAKKDSDAIPLLMGLGSIFRKLERAGDHLTNIAEEIVFFIDAKVIKHNDNAFPDGNGIK